MFTLIVRTPAGEESQTFDSLNRALWTFELVQAGLNKYSKRWVAEVYVDGMIYTSARNQTLIDKVAVKLPYIAIGVMIGVLL